MKSTNGIHVFGSKSFEPRSFLPGWAMSCGETMKPRACPFLSSLKSTLAGLLLFLTFSSSSLFLPLVLCLCLSPVGSVAMMSVASWIFGGVVRKTSSGLGQRRCYQMHGTRNSSSTGSPIPFRPWILLWSVVPTGPQYYLAKKQPLSVLCVCFFQSSMAEGEEAMGQEDWKDKCMVLEALLMKFRMQIIKIRDLTADKVRWREQSSHLELNDPPTSTRWIKGTWASLNGSVFAWRHFCILHIQDFGV